MTDQTTKDDLQSLERVIMDSTDRIEKALMTITASLVMLVPASALDVQTSRNLTDMLTKAIRRVNNAR